MLKCKIRAHRKKKLTSVNQFTPYRQGARCPFLRTVYYSLKGVHEESIKK